MEGKRGRGRGAPTVLRASCFAWLITLSCSATDSTDIVQPDYSIYHQKDKALHQIDWIASRNPTTFQVEELKARDGNYSSTIKVVTVDPSGVGNEVKSKLRFLLDFGEHGRELVTVEVALKLLELLADPTAVETLSLKRGGNPQKILRLLEQCVFKIIPMENERGREVVEAGNLCERKNGRGVDSNRNWPVHWGFREPDYDPSEEYPGLKPFSEPEVQILDELAKEFEPHVWMNMHSGMEALFMPYDHMATLPDDSVGRVSFEFLQQLNTLKCGGRCAVGSGGKSVGAKVLSLGFHIGYLAHGTATDYMHDKLGVPFSFTWEIYGDFAATFQDCFRMFNPLTKKHLNEVVENWADAILAMIELLPASAQLPSQDHGFVHRKFLPFVGIEGEAFGKSETDIGKDVRQTRMAEIYAHVSTIDELLGIRHSSSTWTTLGYAWILWVLVLIVISVMVALAFRKFVWRWLLARKSFALKSQQAQRRL